MILTELSFDEADEDQNSWCLDNFTFGPINLIVGKNSTGKTRTLNVISAITSFINGARALPKAPANCHMRLEREQGAMVYEFTTSLGNIVDEKLRIKNRILFDRNQEGIGRIVAVKVRSAEGKIRFQAPTNYLTPATRRDKLQHPFLDDLVKWSESSIYYHFGEKLGKDRYAAKSDFVGALKLDDLDPRNENMAVAYLKRLETRPDAFAKILDAVRELSYNISEVSVIEDNSITVVQAGQSVESIHGIGIKEEDHNHLVKQHEISQGLFRALSLIIQVVHAQEFHQPSLVLIDDVGEGLDFERSTALVKWLIRNFSDTSSQLIMTTNDRFVMNVVPIEFWSVLSREGGQVRSFNIRNSKKIFESFHSTGLSNFDLFSSEYVQNKSKLEH